MSSFNVRAPLVPPSGTIILPGDKSIAHRCLILSALSCQKVRITNIPLNKDLKATIGILKSLGVAIKVSAADRYGNSICVVQGVGLHGLTKPRNILSAGESGTTIRLMLGLLSAQNFSSKITASAGLLKRPMHRVTYPLRLMNASIESKKHKTIESHREEFAPFAINPSKLKGITYSMPVASAQVKSALLLAGLYAEGSTTVIEKTKTRDHTERLLKIFKANIEKQGNKIIIAKTDKLRSLPNLNVPSDISSAAFFMVLGSIVKGAKITIKGVLLNPTRVGLIKVLKRMGSDIKVMKSDAGSLNHWEPAGDLFIKYSKLRGTTVTKKEVPSLIDELPVLMVAASLARGRTVLKSVSELRVKETDRIKSMCDNLRSMGAKIKVIDVNGSEDIIIDGVGLLKGARVKSFGDHRSAMSMIVAGLAAEGITYIDDVSCISKSFPGFINLIRGFRALK